MLFVYALIASGAWTGPPHWDAAGEALASISLGEASALLITTLAVGLFVHPLQFALIQALEGYSGTALWARALAVARIQRYRRIADDLHAVASNRQLVLDEIRNNPDTPFLLRARAGDAYVSAIVDEQAFRRARASFPERTDRIMPTRLGNVLRRYEDLAGKQYGLSAVTVAPHVTMLAAPEHLIYLRDARGQLDLAVRLCALSLLGSAVAFTFLVSDGLWLLVALLPYGLAYLAYRGAVVAAHRYGRALATLIDVDRFRVYESLHLPLPTDSAEERTRNRDRLMPLLRFESTTSLSYRSPGDADSAATDIPPESSELPREASTS